MTDEALRDLMKQIHDEAAVLRAVAREADLEMAEFVAAAEARRTSERLRRGRRDAGESGRLSALDDCDGTDV